MDKNYFESLVSSIQEAEQANNHSVESSGTAFLTVKVDIDCKLYCDGDFLDLFEANKVKKTQIPTGQHLMTVVSEYFEDISEDHVIDAAEAGKNYLLLINDLNKRIANRQSNEERDATEQVVIEHEQDTINNNLIAEVQKNNYQIEVKINRTFRVERYRIELFFKSALEGSRYLTANYDENFYNSLPKNITTGDFLENKIVDTLFNGGEVYLYDNYAEGELYGGHGKIIENGVGLYVITLADVIDGLERAANGNYKIKNDEELVRKAFHSVTDDFMEDIDFYYYQLMQIILFNELIYD